MHYFVVLDITRTEETHISTLKIDVTKVCGLSKFKL